MTPSFQINRPGPSVSPPFWPPETGRLDPTEPTEHGSVGAMYRLSMGRSLEIIERLDGGSNECLRQ